MQKLLIADNNEEFRLALAEALQQHFHVLSCGNGIQALELLRKEMPELFILDLMLPELDGITLLESSIAEGIHPKTIIASGMLNDYVVACMTRLNIGYMMRKPCSISALVTRVMDVSRDPKQASKPEDLRSRISKLLLSLNFNVKHHGYCYLLDALPFVMEYPEISMTKELYPEVAKLHSCHWRHIERSIRNAIESAWDHRDAAVWEYYFPGASKRPSNAAFLARLAEQLLLEGE